MALSGCQVAIIGAGPYGLATAAHLRAAKVETQVFGQALEFWINNMPAGMLLRSPWDASHISDAGRSLTLNHYHDSIRALHASPIPLERFIGYGLWFQQQVVPDLDERRILRLEQSGGGFRLLLQDGSVVHSERVVVATGIASFAYTPPVFDRLPEEVASHACQHH